MGRRDVACYVLLAAYRMVAAGTVSAAFPAGGVPDAGGRDVASNVSTESFGIPSTFLAAGPAVSLSP